MLYNTQHLVVNRYASHATRNNWLIPQLCVLYINCSMDLVCIDTGIPSVIMGSLNAQVRGHEVLEKFIILFFIFIAHLSAQPGNPLFVCRTSSTQNFLFFSSFLGVMLIKSQTLSRIARLPNLYCIYSI